MELSSFYDSVPSLARIAMLIELCVFCSIETDMSELLNLHKASGTCEYH